jgi:hypothetical protein
MMAEDRPFSPVDGTWVKDDFVANDSVADAEVGALAWEIAALAAGGSTVALSTAGAIHDGAIGVLRLTTGNSATNEGEYMRGLTDGFILQGSNGGGGFAFRARLVTAITTSNFRIGVDDSITVTDPTVGIWVKCDGGVLSLESDSAAHGDAACAVSGVSTLTSGTTMVIDQWHKFKVTWEGSNAQGGPRFVQLWVDGEAAASTVCEIDNDETAELKIVHWQDSGGAAVRIFEIDYFEFWQFR